MLDHTFFRMCAIGLLAVALVPAQGPRRQQNPPPKGPWMNKSLSPDQRADLLIQQMTLDEKISRLHGLSMPRGTGTYPGPLQCGSLGGAGFIPGIPRLGIPDLQMADAATGVARGAGFGRYSTALPSGVSEASSWDLKLAREYGALVGSELRDQGFNMSLAGGINLTREPRNGRNFEYKGEDPILAGRLIAEEIKGVQSQGIIGDIKHYALNDQETGRNSGSANIGRRAMRETDLLAFEIGIKGSNVGAVMCSYNRLNGVYACENPYLLNEVLKKDFGFKGFVISDWFATHSTVKAALSGLDMEMPDYQYFGDALKKAVQSGEVPMSRLNDMVRRVLRTEFAHGLFDNPPRPQVVNVFEGFRVAQRVAEQGTVLLKNAGQLPLDASAIRSIAVIGGHADAGVLSGGGSAQVDPAGGNAVEPPPSAAGPGPGFIRPPVYHRSSPLEAIRKRAPNAKVEFDSGGDPLSAAALAKKADVAIVFAVQPTTEGRDEQTLALPDNQDELIRAVGSANPHTIVVLETGGAVTMPWLDTVGAVVEAWYPGIRGGQAIARILFGDVNPSAKLPITFPASDADLPHPKIAGPPAAEGENPFQNTTPFDINYTEGLKVGYKWYDAENKQPLFPFGYGLSYTTYGYQNLKIDSGQQVKVSFEVENTGARAGAEIAQVYVGLPEAAGEPPRRLVAWEKVELAPGEAKTVSLTLDPFYLSIFNAEKNAWELMPGDYKVFVGASSRDTPLSGSFRR